MTNYDGITPCIGDFTGVMCLRWMAPCKGLCGSALKQGTVTSTSNVQAPCLCSAFCRIRSGENAIESRGVDYQEMSAGIGALTVNSGRTPAVMIGPIQC